MNTDIENSEDIKTIVEGFYTKVLKDPLIGELFIKANFDLETHIPVMVSFWESILLNKNSYHGNPMVKHIEMNRTITLEQDHFDRWLMIWTDTIRTQFCGERAENAILRAGTIAQIMQSKLRQSEAG